MYMTNIIIKYYMEFIIFKIKDLQTYDFIKIMISIEPYGQSEMYVFI